MASIKLQLIGRVLGPCEYGLPVLFDKYGRIADIEAVLLSCLDEALVADEP